MPTVAFVLKRKWLFAFALGFAVAMIAVGRFVLSWAADPAAWNVYLVVNFVGVTLGAILQTLIAPLLGVFMGGPIEAIGSGGETYALVGSGTWIADYLDEFLLATNFVGAFVQGLVYAVIGSSLLRRLGRKPRRAVAPS